jgi:hypothetical protein
MSSLKKAFDKLENENGGTPAPANSPTSSTLMPAPAAATGNEPRCLRLVASGTRCWELPWTGFYGAALTAADACADADALDCVELSFAHFEAVLRGKNLAGLMGKLHAMNLPEVRAVDKKFLGLSNNGVEPAVVSIEVRKLGSS